MTIERPPFSMRTEAGQYNGFSVELWQLVAEAAGLSYELVSAPTFGAMLDAVRSRQADIAIANISITADRETTLDFSQPIFDAGLQIMVRADRDGSGPLAAIFNRRMLELVLPWWFERDHHPFFRKSLREGWWDAFWWSLQRLASAGFQDIIPRTVPGRLLGIATSIAALFLVSAFVATISATVTLNELRSDIQSVSDLYGKRVGTTRASTASAFLRQQGLAANEYDGLPGLFSALDAQDVDAVVHDAPLLEYFASREGRGRVLVVGKVFKEEKYGIALQDGSPLRERVDRALLQVRESGRYDQLRARWFSAREP
jgi:polar amino acid transport system substrate-binding protein